MTKAKIIQLENAVEDCAKFLALVPLEAIAKGMTWLPSEEALELGRRAKESVNRVQSQQIRNS